MKDKIINIKISIIIVAYNNLEILIKALESLFQYNDLGKEIEVIVVDNSDSNNDIESYFNNNKDVIYIKNINKGFGQGNNVGAKIASGDILAFINPDIIFVEPVLSKIYKTFCDDKNIKIVGCKLLDRNKKPNFSFFIDFDDSFIKRLLLKLFVKIDYFNQNYMYISGSNLFVDRNVFLEAGMFDENIFLYYEEPDITRRIKNVCPNCKIVYEKWIKLIHLEGKSTCNTDVTKHVINSIKYYGNKYNLNCLKKIKFEYKYRLMKALLLFIRREEYNSVLLSSMMFKNEYRKLINEKCNNNIN